MNMIGDIHIENTEKHVFKRSTCHKTEEIKALLRNIFITASTSNKMR